VYSPQHWSASVIGSGERACAETGIGLTDEIRRQLVGGLLARQHLILSGSPASRKCELARALALFLADGREDHACSLFGHPWWACGTGDVVYYANMQMAYSEWRLVYFLATVLADGHGTRRRIPMRFIGTYDSDTRPELDARTLNDAALVHMDATSD
jgi:hypothetical protein